jgi:hypothetical protein
MNPISSAAASRIASHSSASSKAIARVVTAPVDRSNDTALSGWRFSAARRGVPTNRIVGLRSPRDDPSFAALSGPAGAYVRAADRATVEAITVLAGISWLAQRAGADPRPLAARRAQLLMEIGQRAAAREAWLIVLGSDRVDALAATRYLVFAEWYAQRNQTSEASVTLTKAAEAAAAAKDDALLRRICGFGRELAVPLPSCVQ